MPPSKYSRLNPQVQPDLTSTPPVPEDKSMHFSNSIPGSDAYGRLSSPSATVTGDFSNVPKSQPQVQVQPSGGYGDGLADTGFFGDIPPKRLSKA